MKEAITCGIQLYNQPLMKFQPWQLWEKGYIEYFTGVIDESGNYMVFMYIPMEKLGKILEKFQEKLKIN